MRCTATRARLAGMQSPAYRQFILEAAIDGSVIHGMLSTATGQQRAFHGWIELNTALEALLTALEPELHTSTAVTRPARRSPPAPAPTAKWGRSTAVRTVVGAHDPR
jgi:hypothetical protein